MTGKIKKLIKNLDAARGGVYGAAALAAMHAADSSRQGGVCLVAAVRAAPAPQRHTGCAPQHICRWVWACCPRDALAEPGAQRDALGCPRAMRFTTADIMLVSCVLLWSLWRVVYPSPLVFHSLASARQAGICFVSADDSVRTKCDKNTGSNGTSMISLIIPPKDMIAR